MSSRKLSSTIELTLTLTAGSATANETVARWVDADGVTHFGDTQLAPAHARTQVVGPTSAMDAPVVHIGERAGDGPSWSLINRAPKQNPRGWRTRGEGARSGPIHYRSR